MSDLQSSGSELDKDQLKHEFEKFKQLKTESINKLGAFEIDEFGLSFSQKPDLYIGALTHGNEVIGLQIVNLLLSEIIKTGRKPNWSVMLHNVLAFQNETRYIDYDLNRSFLRNDDSTHLESIRANKISDIVLGLKPRFIIDLHQTIEATKSIFAVTPEIPELIRYSFKIAPEIPIVSFSNSGGFSDIGKTLIEFAAHYKIPALVFELGKKGFNSNIAENFKKTLLSMDIDAILGQNPKETPKIRYYFIEDIIPNTDYLRLKPGLVSFQKLQKDEVLAESENPKTDIENSRRSVIFRSPKDYLMLFPRYENIKEYEKELGYLAIEKEL